MIHLNLKAKFAIVAGTMILAVALIITGFLTHQQEVTIREELLARAVALTDNMAYNCQLPLAAENKSSLRNLAQGLFKQAEVSYVQFQSSSGKDLLSEAESGGHLLDIVAVRAVQEHPGGSRSAWVRTADGREFVDVQTTVVAESGTPEILQLGPDAGDTDEPDILATRRNAEHVTLGRVRVGVTTNPAQKRIAHLRGLATMLSVVIALAGSLVAALFIHVLTRPLGQLMEGNRRVARGDFSLRLEVRARDEFGRLARSYNQMADEIQRSRELAESYLASLRSNAEHLEEANRALQKSNADLAKASRMKSEFLAVMSHELRTPLNVIIGFSEVMLDQTFGDMNPKQQRHAENILSSGRHLLSLINDILDLSKVEAGRMKLVPEPFDLRQSLDEVQSLVRNLAGKKGLEIHCAKAPAVTPITDPKVFRQVLLNLLSNAIKFTPDGGRIDFNVQCIDGRTLRSDAATRMLSPERRLAIVPRRVLLVEVHDTGIGISPEDQERVFEAFQQVDATYARGQEGTGLGLALTRKLVVLLGGDIWLQSAAGEGSTFRFWIPFEARDTEPDTGMDAAVQTSDLHVAGGGAVGDAAALTPPAPRMDVRRFAIESRAGGAAISLPQWPWGVAPADDAASPSVASPAVATASDPTVIDVALEHGIPSSPSAPATPPGPALPRVRAARGSKTGGRKSRTRGEGAS